MTHSNLDLFIKLVKNRTWGRLRELISPKMVNSNYEIIIIDNDLDF